MRELLKYANDSIPRTATEKLEIIKNAAHFYGEYMTALGIDWKHDPNSCDTPMRVAKAFVNDLAEGCYNAPPKITDFENSIGYDGIVFQGNIDVKSFCSHHHLPFIGKAHVAYIPAEGMVGLSKLNRAVEYFARRPQVQENLTMQVHKFIDDMCTNNKGVAVMIEANHMCACVRGVKHDSTMMTSKMSGAFMNDPASRNEFYRFVDKLDSK
jgi:GTP cyclohydrolase I